MCWNKPFKTRVTEPYDQWLSEGIHQYAEGGNIKAPSRKGIVEWILDAWSQLPIESIIKSFKCCGLNLANDGTEDAADEMNVIDDDEDEMIDVDV